MGTIKNLSQAYPSALPALQTSRDAAVQRVMANLDDKDAIAEVAQLNESLGQSAASVARYDSAIIRKSVIEQTATNIEVLAGAGKAAETGQLTKKLFAFDHSETTRKILEQHLARAKGENQ